MHTIFRISLFFWRGI